MTTDFNELEQYKTEMLSQIDQAEMVFIGIGQEMQVSMADLLKIQQFAEKWELLVNGKAPDYLAPFLIRYYLSEEYFPDIVKAYRTLHSFVKEKNYYVVSLATDDLYQLALGKEENSVFPCGGYRMLQCEERCCDELFEIPGELTNAVSAWIETGSIPAESLCPRCPHCGAPLVVNQYGQTKYNEYGYLENWQKYMTWLQKTVNRRLCILELGVGMEFPSVIRSPLEKVCFYNRKSKLLRVHSMLYQFSDEIGERGISMKCSPMTLLSYMGGNQIEF